MTNFADSTFCTEQDLTGAVKDTGVYSTKSIPIFGLRQLGMGKKVFCTIYPEVALEGAGDTCDVDIWSDTVGTFDGTPAQVVKAAAVIPAAWAPGDDPISFEIPFALIAANETHIALKFVPRGSGDVTAGTVTAKCSLEPGRNLVMPRGDTNVG